jgi:hypothetical protein
MYTKKINFENKYVIPYNKLILIILVCRVYIIVVPTSAQQVY